MNLDIYQLSKLVSKQKVNALGLFKDNKIDSVTKYLFLYENIVDGRIKNDEDAKRALNYSENSKAFGKFKERYTRKILDYTLLSGTNNQITAYLYDEHFKLLKLYTAARYVKFQYQNDNAIKIFKYVFNQAKKMEFFDLLLFAGFELRQYYAFINPNRKKYLEYDREMDKIKYDLNKMLDLSKFYDQISHESLSSKEENAIEYNKSILEKSNKFLHDIESNDSFFYKNKAHQIAAYTLTLNNKLEESISISKKSVKLYEENSYQPKNNLYVAYKDIMSTYLKLKDLDNANIYLHKILAMFTQKHYNYFRLKSLEYTIYANSKDYASLIQTTVDVLSSKKLLELKTVHEEWKLREAFANILIETDQISTEEIIGSKYKEFKLNKFLNEVTTFTKDKRGTNISILVVELIHFLIRKQYDKLLDRLDALNVYTFRYLRKDETLRSNCFIKMLLKLPEAEYHPLRTQRYVAKYEKKLRETPFEVSMKAVNVEIIPYEHLWEIIIGILDENIKKKK